MEFETTPEDRSIGIEKAGSSNRLMHFGMLGMTVVLGGVLYLNSLGNMFTNWDDSMIYSNPGIQSLGWESLVRLFTPVKGETYQPVRVLSYAIDYHFWKLNPVGYHITNILFYMLTCIFVF
jgi:hypothetical protein